MERRFSTSPQASLRFTTGSGSSLGVIHGYAAVFYNPADKGTEYRLSADTFEQIGKHAFDRVISERQDVAGLFNHDVNKLLGRTSSGTLRLSVDSRGLRYSIDLPDSPDGHNALESVRRQDLRGSSFTFYIADESYTKERRDGQWFVIRTILDVGKVDDVGPVTFPAYKSTPVTVARSKPKSTLSLPSAPMPGSVRWENERDQRLASYKLRAQLIAGA